MNLETNKILWTKGYFTLSKYLHGSTGNLETNLGFQSGRLSDGFFIGRLSKYPEINEFDIAGYSITPEHRFETPKGYDLNVLKQMALDSMRHHGLDSLIKIFPNTRHNPSIDPDIQYPYGKGGIPQWKLIKDFPVYIFKEIRSNEKGNINFFNK